jgi:hypothetical protein
MKYLLDTAVWCHLTPDQHLIPRRVRELVTAEPQVGLETNALPAGFNGDTLDRTVAATARVLGLLPITMDAQLRDHARLMAVEFSPFKPGRRSA